MTTTNVKNDSNIILLYPFYNKNIFKFSISTIKEKIHIYVQCLVLKAGKANTESIFFNLLRT